MYKVTADVSEAERRLAIMLGQLQEFPDKIEEEVTLLQTQDMNRQRPETVRSGNRVSTTIDRSPRGAQKSRSKRTMERYARRLVRRFTPKPVRQLRRYARVGRGLDPKRLGARGIPNVLLPIPLRRFKGVIRKGKRIMRSQQRAVYGSIPGLRLINRARGLARRLQRQMELLEAMSLRVRDAGKAKLKWRK